MNDPEIAKAETDVFRLGLLGHAERQTKALESVKDAVQILMWVAIIGLAAGLVVAFN